MFLFRKKKKAFIKEKEIAYFPSICKMFWIQVWLFKCFCLLYIEYTLISQWKFTSIFFVFYYPLQRSINLILYMCFSNFKICFQPVQKMSIYTVWNNIFFKMALRSQRMIFDKLATLPLYKRYPIWNVLSRSLQKSYFA